MLLVLKMLLNINFNFIKVRLKHNGASSPFAKLEFQFHKGTIKTQGIAGRNGFIVISIP